MNRFGIKHAVGFGAMVFIVLAIFILFKYSLSASVQLTLWTAIVIAGILLVLLICYVTPEPGEVVVIFSPGGPPKVLRGPGLKAPWHRATFVRLTPTPIEVRREGKKPLITLHGLPVAAVVNAQIAVRDDDDSIRAAARYFSGANNAQIQQYFQPILEGTATDVVAEMEFLDLIQKRAEFSEKVGTRSKFYQYGYELRDRVQLKDVTQLSPEDAGLHGVDEVRARAEAQKQETAFKTEALTAKKQLANEETNADEASSDRERRLKEKQHQDAAAIGKQEEAKDQAIQTRRIEKESAIHKLEFDRDLALSKQRAEKLAQEAETEKLNQELRCLTEVSAAETQRQVRACTIEADREEKKALLEIEVQRKKADLEIDKERLELRGKELRLNQENQGGDLDFQLKKEAIQAAEKAANEQAKVLAAALGSTKFTFLGDAAAASDLARDCAKSIALTSRISEILAILNDIDVRKTVAGTVQLIREATTGVKPSKEREAHDPLGAQGADRGDRDFKP